MLPDNNEDGRGILNLSDELLLHICSYLKSWDLISLSEICSRFEKIVHDKRLWRDADFSDEGMSLKKAHAVIKFLKPDTRILTLYGFKKRKSKKFAKSPLLSESLLKEIKILCPHLEAFAVCEAFVDASKVTLRHLGYLGNLKMLKIIDCEFFNTPIHSEGRSYFRNIHEVFPNLEVLEICGANWVHDYDTYALSKIYSLKSLSLRNNIRIGVTMVYLALSFRFGFLKLESLDLRGTSLKDSDMPSIMQNKKINELCIGPIGQDKNRIEESIIQHNLVFPCCGRPNNEEQNEVVVIDLKPEGPQWRHVRSNELDGLGFGWVQKEMVKRKREEDCIRKKEENADPFFVGADGKPLKKCESSCKRKLSDNVCSDNDTKMIRICSADETIDKKVVLEESELQESCDDIDNCSSMGDESDEPADVENPLHGLKWNGLPEPKICGKRSLPDSGLSDRMVLAFRNNSCHLQKLVVAGCALTNQGLLELIEVAPSLKFVDVRFTHVSQKGIEDAKQVRSELCIIGDDCSSESMRNNDR